MRRGISIVLMLLANVLILAHAVVPHHHHNKVFMSVVNMLDDDLQNRFDHEHIFFNHFAIGDFFVSSQSRVVLYNQCVLNAAAEKLCEVLSFLSISKSVTYRPYNARGFTDFIYLSTGFRAPPAC